MTASFRFTKNETFSVIFKHCEQALTFLRLTTQWLIKSRMSPCFYLMFTTENFSLNLESCNTLFYYDSLGIPKLPFLCLACFSTFALPDIKALFLLQSLHNPISVPLYASVKFLYTTLKKANFLCMNTYFASVII